MFSRIKLVNKKDKELIDDIKNSNHEDNNIWRIPNLIFPLAAIFLAILSNFLFGDDKYSSFTYVNIVLNGSLPLIAINQISASGVYIFKFNKHNEQKYKLNTSFLRTKLYLSALGVLILSVIFFTYQVIKVPFYDFIAASILIIISGLLIWASSWLTKRIFLLQDSLIEKTYSSEIREEAKKTHGNNW